MEMTAPMSLLIAHRLAGGANVASGVYGSIITIAVIGAWYADLTSGTLETLATELIVRPQPIMTIIYRVFKTPRWVTMFAAAGFVVSVFGAGLTTSSSGINTLSIVLCAIAILFALGLADSLLSHVYITPKTLEYFSNFHGRVLQQTEIRSVSWNAGCPVIIVLATGDKLRLPALDDNLKMANSIRAWLKRPYVGIENDSNRTLRDKAAQAG
jgi:hypothetical protein